MFYYCCYCLVKNLSLEKEGLFMPYSGNLKGFRFYSSHVLWTSNIKPNNIR